MSNFSDRLKGIASRLRVRVTVTKPGPRLPSQRGSA
jgi:hypothetical protein